MSTAYSRIRTSRLAIRRPHAAVIGVLPLIGLAVASLDGAIVYAAGQLMRAIGAH